MAGQLFGRWLRRGGAAADEGAPPPAEAAETAVQTAAEAAPPVETTMPSTDELAFALPPDQRVEALGHRSYIGGQTPEMWYGIGRMQYHFLVSEGLRPDHVFLDVACGALRLGQYLIPFLAPGNYQGIEGERALIDSGLEHEVLYGLGVSRRPRFVCNYDFDLTGLAPFDFAIAQSLLTHLTPADIERCFQGVAAGAAPGARFYVTWFEGPEDGNPDGPSHAQRNWHYPFERLAAMAATGGWALRRIGDWKHPRGQMIAVGTRG